MFDFQIIFFLFFLRNLLLKNFVRLGRWYVLPYEHGSGDIGWVIESNFIYVIPAFFNIQPTVMVSLPIIL